MGWRLMAVRREGFWADRITVAHCRQRWEMSVSSAASPGCRPWRWDCKHLLESAGRVILSLLKQVPPCLVEHS